ncbi:pseudouridine synthase [Nocardia takedensis]
MNTSARRDGTPDRRKRGDQPSGAGTGRTAGPRGARAAQRGAAADRGARGEQQQRGTRSGSTGRSGANPAGRSGGAPGTRAGGSGRSGGDPANRSNPGARSSQNPAAKSGQAPAPRKTKNPKPQRQVAAPPLLSNAKPARRQYVESESSGAAHEKMPWGEGERLQKVLAKAGVASRRAAEELIAQGRVEVDGLIVREQGLRIDAQTAVVRVDGTRVMVREELVHLALNKPKGWQSTMSDDLGRPCVGDIVAERIAAGQRLFHVGRLDADTEGLLLLTNDGDLAHRLMHPSFEVSKTYLATVTGEVDNRRIGKRLRDGVELEDGPAKVDRFQVLELGEGRSLVKLVLHEGRKHIVRRLLDEVGHPVNRLVRTNIGPVSLGDQRPGTLRVLGRDEVGKLYEAVSL